MLLLMFIIIMLIAVLILLIYKWLDANQLRKNRRFSQSQGPVTESLNLYRSETERTKQKFPRQQVQEIKKMLETVRIADPEQCPFPLPSSVFEKEAEKVTEDRQGIVTCAGGKTYLTCFLVQLSVLRFKLNCTLPVEIWHLPDELQNEDCRQDLLQNYGDVRLRCLDERLQTQLQWNGSGKYTVKIASIVASDFTHVLFLDADNNVLRDPSFLFETDEYKNFGAIFWPDYWNLEKEAPIFEAVTTKPWYKFAQESGQMVINKAKCWRGLWATLNLHTQFYSHFESLLPCPDNFGDKDTFHTCFLGTNCNFFMIPFPTSSVGFFDNEGKYNGIAMAQKDPKGEFLFVHLNAMKWDVMQFFPSWEVVFTSKPDDKTRWVDRRSHEVFGESVRRFSFCRLFKNYEAICWKELKRIRELPWYKNAYRQSISHRIGSEFIEVNV